MTYPPADRRSQWYDGVVASSRFPGGRVEKVVWHMTETPGWPGYRDGQIAPHYTVRPDFAARRMQWRAHFPDTHHSRALRNEPGGVQTNRDGALQVEIVGTCDETKTWPASMLRSWDLPDWAIEGLAAFAAWCHREHGVPLRAPGTWLAYGRDARRPGVVPASYGKSPARFTGAQWDAFRGHCGHQHAAEQTHGDPGRLPMDRILARARQMLTPEPHTTEDDMPKLDDVIDLGKGQSAVLGEADGKVTVEQAMAIQTAALVEIQRGQERLIDAVDAIASALRGRP